MPSGAVRDAAQPTGTRIAVPARVGINRRRATACATKGNDMQRTPSTTRIARLRPGALALAAAAALAGAGCSRSGSDVPPPAAAASVPSAPVAAATPPVASAPVALAPAPAPAPPRTVVAQNDTRASRHDEPRRAQPLPPRADRDNGSAYDQPSRPQRVAAAPCSNCGVVESFDQVKVQGQTNGTGAVAGGLGGAVIGNRIAGGNNRTLGGVVGAVGGGLIGNAIEKHQRTTTAYDVHVRMDDGSLRTVRQATAPSLGSKVRVEADGLHSRS
jgi:outer membrane lipoprotein SlyB